MPCISACPHVRKSPLVTASVMKACLHPVACPSSWHMHGNPQETIVKQPDPPCDQLDTALLRLLLIGAILRADAPVLGLLADVMQATGLLPDADEAEEP